MCAYSYIPTKFIYHKTILSFAINIIMTTISYRERPYSYDEITATRNNNKIGSLNNGIRSLKQGV